MLVAVSVGQGHHTSGPSLSPFISPTALLAAGKCASCMFSTCAPQACCMIRKNSISSPIARERPLPPPLSSKSQSTESGLLPPPSRSLGLTQERHQGGRFCPGESDATGLHV